VSLWQHPSGSVPGLAGDSSEAGGAPTARTAAARSRPARRLASPEVDDVSEPGWFLGRWRVTDHVQLRTHARRAGFRKQDADKFLCQSDGSGKFMTQLRSVLTAVVGARTVGHWQAPKSNGRLRPFRPGEADNYMTCRAVRWSGTLPCPEQELRYVARPLQAARFLKKS